MVESWSIGFGDRLGCVRAEWVRQVWTSDFGMLGAFGVMEMKMGFMINSIGMG